MHTHKFTARTRERERERERGRKKKKEPKKKSHRFVAPANGSFPFLIAAAAAARNECQLAFELSLQLYLMRMPMTTTNDTWSLLFRNLSQIKVDITDAGRLQAPSIPSSRVVCLIHQQRPTRPVSSPSISRFRSDDICIVPLELVIRLDCTLEWRAYLLDNVIDEGITL